MTIDFKRYETFVDVTSDLSKDFVNLDRMVELDDLELTHVETSYQLVCLFGEFTRDRKEDGVSRKGME